MEFSVEVHPMEKKLLKLKIMKLTENSETLRKYPEISVANFPGIDKCEGDKAPASGNVFKINTFIPIKSWPIKVLLLFVLVFTATQINASLLGGFVEGYVNDDLGQALPGVAVTLKNKNVGVLTDVNGYYNIAVNETDRILVFSFVGMETRFEEIKGRSRIDVVLKPDQAKLEEVVVVGYGTTPGIRIRGRSSLRKSNALQAVPVSCQMVVCEDEADFNTENYASVHENGFKEVKQNPLSTFSVDVDRASYSNIRRFINSGQMPPVDAVRIEEMINYFSYDYQSPSSDQPFAVHHEMAVCPWNQEHYLMKVGLKGKEIAKDNLPASNLVFLIDVSGSMSPANKLPLLKSAFSLLVDELRPQDRVSMVVYAGASGCVLDPTPGNQKRTILEALNRLEAGGSTAGGAGLKLAYEKAAASFIEGGNNRIILASDGDFNVGVSSNAEMERLVTANRDKGIFMTVLGFGMGNYKDDRLEIIANKGNGNYAYIDNLQEARKTLIEEFGGTLFTIAKDVKFQIEFNPSRVLAYRLIGYENRLLNAEDFNDDKKDAGEIGAGHTVTALYEIIPVGAADAATWVKQIDPLKYQSMEKADETNGATKSIVDEWLTLKLRYKQPDGNKSTLLEIPVKGKVKSFDNASDDFRFAASVAGFGMLLRQSEFKGDLSYPQVREMAMAARGDDADGFKGEMVRLVKTAETLSRQLAVAE